MELVKLMGHAWGESRASLAAVSGKVEGLGDGGVGHFVVTATLFDGAACLGNEAAGVADFDGLHRSSVGCG